MTAPLTDPWFDAEFYGNIQPDGSFTRQDGVEGAQGLLLWCPCGYGKPEYPLDGGRPHMIMVPFANPLGAPVAPPSHGPFNNGVPVRWTLQGAGLDTLTITPSVDVKGGVNKSSCWHGFITAGQVTSCG